MIGVAPPSPSDAGLPEPVPALAPLGTHPVPLTVPLIMADADFGNIMFGPGSGKITSTLGPALQSLTDAKLATKSSGKVSRSTISVLRFLEPPVMAIGAQFI